MDSSGELHGWKEIAAYLGRSVRGAQRWERELGLPVRRLKTASGQAIFARREEIEAWKARVGEGPREASLPVRRLTPRAAAAMIAAAVFLLTAAAVIAPRLAWPALPPTRFAYEGTSIVARDAAGRIVWSRDLGVAFDPDEGLRARPGFVNGVVEGDVDGDANAEVLVVVPGNQSARRRFVPDVLICFSRSGQELWRHQPDLSPIAFGPARRQFDGPWLITDVIAEPAGIARGAWIAVSHHTWWPSGVYHVAPGGTAVLKYVQSGTVYGLGAVGPVDNRSIVAAGVINEIGAATLALLDPARRAVSPQTRGGEFECRDCGGDPPMKVLALPRSELNEVMPMPYNAVRSVRRLGGALQTAVYEASNSRDLIATSLFEFDESLTPVSRSFDDSYWTLHELWHRAGRLDHPASSCPERRRSLRARAWEPGSGWRDLVVQVTPLPAPGGRP